jgi:hypothetical protein
MVFWSLGGEFVPPGDDAKVRKVGRCIYCGATGVSLSREHVIPYGLKTDWLLLEASCLCCSRVTAQFEGEVLRGMFGPFRTAKNFPTRRKAERPKALPVTVAKGGQEFKVELPPIEVAVFQRLHFPPPGFVEGRSGEGIGLVGVDFLFYGKRLDEIASELGADSLSVSVATWAPSFARLLAKVAYGTVVLRFGPDYLDDVFVLPAILGKSNDVGHWVGAGRPDIPPESRTQDHYVQIEHAGAGIVMARVALLPRYGGAEYLVVVGHKASSLERGA